MKFDSNLAWKQATAAIGANRDLLLALAGVFFMLPGLAFSLLFPQPEPTPGMAPEAMVKLMSDYYSAALPYVIPMAVLQAGGTLAMLTLFTDRTRPTVGQAIRRGFASILTYVLALMLVGFGLGGAAVILLTVASLVGLPALALVGLAVAIVGAVYVGIKTSLLGPVVAVEGERNPMVALRRSWRLTKGNSVRIGLFYLLVFVGFVICLMIAMALVGIVLALVAGDETAKVISAVVSAAVGSVLTLYFVAISAAVHRQLSGPSPEAARAPFE